MSERQSEAKKNLIIPFSSYLYNFYEINITGL